MESGLYVALSSQVALEKRLNTIAHNVANANTVGFRGSKVRFDEVLDGMTAKAPSFVSMGTSYLSPINGGVEQTGGNLDFAIKGDAWFSVESPAGNLVTRDGRFKMTDTGELVTLDGYPVLDPGGAAIQLNPAGGPVTAGKDGFLRQKGVQVAALGLVAYTPTPDYRRYGNSGIVAETPAEPIVDSSNVGVLQGYVEQSNVNAVEEMSKLITVHRAFDNIAAMIRDTEGALEEAIRTLGSGS